MQSQEYDNQILLTQPDAIPGEQDESQESLQIEEETKTNSDEYISNSQSKEV